VVVVTLPKSKSGTAVIERKEWDIWANTSALQTDDWKEKAIHAFCFINNILRDEVTDVDFTQTRTREELDNLPDFQF
jgi:hypothetical protein